MLDIYIGIWNNIGFCLIYIYTGDMQWYQIIYVREEVVSLGENLETKMVEVQVIIHFQYFSHFFHLRKIWLRCRLLLIFNHCSHFCLHEKKVEVQVIIHFQYLFSFLSSFEEKKSWKCRWAKNYVFYVLAIKWRFSLLMPKNWYFCRLVMMGFAKRDENFTPNVSMRCYKKSYLDSPANGQTSVGKMRCGGFSVSLCVSLHSVELDIWKRSKIFFWRWSDNWLWDAWRGVSCCLGYEIARTELIRCWWGPDVNSLWTNRLGVLG